MSSTLAARRVVSPVPKPRSRRASGCTPSKVLVMWPFCRMKQKRQRFVHWFVTRWSHIVMNTNPSSTLSAEWRTSGSTCVSEAVLRDVEAVAAKFGLAGAAHPYVAATLVRDISKSEASNHSVHASVWNACENRRACSDLADVGRQVQVLRRAHEGHRRTVVPGKPVRVPFEST